MSLPQNVQTLSNAIAVAIQQASSGQGTSQQASASPSFQQGTSQPPSSSTSNRQHSANVVLPSFLKRRRATAAATSSKKQKTVQSWDRDIVCLPKQCASTHHVSYPRGKYRARLGSLGLIGKLHLSSEMSVEEVEREIRSVFYKPMGSREDFPFVFLQPTGVGSRSLTVPSVSTSYAWTAQQVARLSGNKAPIYILAQDDLTVSDSELDSSDSDSDQTEYERSKKKSVSVPPEEPQSNNTNVASSSREGARHTSEDLYRDYVDLIDLTNSPTGSTENHLDGTETDVDEDLYTDLPPVSLNSDDDRTSGTTDLITTKHVLLQHQRRVIKAED